jgi:hypothetical protein
VGCRNGVRKSRLRCRSLCDLHERHGRVRGLWTPRVRRRRPVGRNAGVLDGLHDGHVRRVLARCAALHDRRRTDLWHEPSMGNQHAVPRRLQRRSLRAMRERHRRLPDRHHRSHVYGQQLGQRRFVPTQLPLRRQSEQRQHLPLQRRLRRSVSEPGSLQDEHDHALTFALAATRMPTAGRPTPPQQQRRKRHAEKPARPTRTRKRDAAAASVRGVSSRSSSLAGHAIRA